MRRPVHVCQLVHRTMGPCGSTRAPRSGAAGPPRRRPTHAKQQPCFRKADGFNGQSRTAAASGMSYPAYGAPQPGAQAYDPYTQSGPVRTFDDRGPMTIDSVVQKTTMTLGLTVLVAAATWLLTPEIRLRRGRLAVPAGDGRRPRRLRAVDGQLVQAGGQPRAGAGLRGARGALHRRLLEGARGDVRRRARGGGRARHHGGRRRHPGGVQVLQHPGHPDVPQVGRRRDARFRRAGPAGRGAGPVRQPRSGSTASVRWACCPA